jgi:osmotically-inducible protein OsmY
MTSTSRLGVWTTVTAFLFVAAACNNTATGLKRDAEENKRQAVELGAEAQAKADEARARAAEASAKAQVETAKAVDAVEKAAEATSDAARNAIGTTGAAVQTLDVKAALIADKRVVAKEINVDTDHATKTVVLKGRVPTEEQKTIAGQIAVAKAPGYHVRNELKVVE